MSHMNNTQPHLSITVNLVIHVDYMLVHTVYQHNTKYCTCTSHSEISLVAIIKYIEGYRYW